MQQQFDYDVLVIGSGAAGLSLALQLPLDKRVAIISKRELSAGSSSRAQGGIAAVLDPTDDIQNHIQDTIEAGAKLGNNKAIRFTIENAKQSIDWLIGQQVPFTPDNDDPTGYHLTQEGGHSHRRIIHAADRTGWAVSETLLQRATEAKNISLLTHKVAVDLITNAKTDLPGNRCIGAYIMDQQTGHIDSYSAQAVVLATGGASKVYLYTSNSDGSSGDGIAMAWRAGCRIANMEFNQFHPTCLYHPKAKSFLISEAVRGEGGKLRLANGDAFMQRFDDRLELAPRDIVARAIDHEMKRSGDDCVYLDISHRGKDFIVEHFPTIYERCLTYGIDISQDPIPVVPAAHYTCGGIMTNEHGLTDIEGLYAIGETAFTGLHGANRLASNSLLECFVYAQSAARHITTTWPAEICRPVIKSWDTSKVTDSDEDVILSHNWDELRRFMWDYVGIVRTNKRLKRAQHRVDLLLGEINEFYSNYRVTSDLVELRNLALVASLIIASAQQRKESRGLHYTLDYPNTASVPRNTILTPHNYHWV
ncbi:MAG: L-aspartate oxidase [Gammaproteobacteria bacterium]|jgi:L-aspartate oxidase|nr:L-aspartate oxidase [Gammaproteobacteria bacterium]